jgi:ankyrin repeat protein
MQLHHELPDRLDLGWYRKEAKALLRAFGAGESDAVARVDEALGERARERFRLADAQWVIAQEHGFRTWAEFARWVQTREPAAPVGRIGPAPVARYEERARMLARAAAGGEDDAVRRVRASVPRLADFAGGGLPLRDAKLVVAREYGFPTWRELVVHVERAVREHEGRSEPAAAALAAIRRGDVGALRVLLDEHPELTGHVQEGASSTLLEAIAQPDVVGDRLETELGVDRGVVELLIERGSALDVPLNLAACFNRSELAQMLLDAGADPTATEIWGLTPLQTAVYHGSAEAADLLAAVALVPDAFYVAAATGRLDALARWFDGGALRPEAFANRPNLADVGWPPLAPPRDEPQEVLDEAFALAAYSGRLEAAAWLLDRGASVDGRAHGLTALHWAIVRGRLDTVRWLLDRGADPTVRDAVHDRTPVGWGGGEAQRGGADRIATRDLLVARSEAAAAGDLRLAFERAWATWGERGQAVLDSGLRYGGTDPVLVHVSKREGRYEITDRAGAFAAAGRPRGWRELADALETELAVNVSRQGEVFLPATARRELAWVAALPQRVADASLAFYGALLELDAG